MFVPAKDSNEFYRQILLFGRDQMRIRSRADTCMVASERAFAGDQTHAYPVLALEPIAIAHVRRRKNPRAIRISSQAMSLKSEQAFLK